MDILETLKKKEISTDYFNLLGHLTNYSGKAFEIEGVLDLTKQKLKEAYPNLSDTECNWICNPLGMTGDGYLIRSLHIIDNTVLWLINNQYDEDCYSIFWRVARLDPSQTYYRDLTSEYFFYNLDYKPLDPGRKIVSPNNTYLSSDQERKYTHFIACAMTAFLKDQGIDTEVIPEDLKDGNGKPYNDGHLLVQADYYQRKGYHIFVDRNFISLASSFAKKENSSMKLLLFTGKKLEMSATFHQTFDEFGNCTIQISDTELPFFSLNHGYLKTPKKSATTTIVSYDDIFPKKKRPSTKNKFPYSAILIDADKKEKFVQTLPSIQSLTVASISSSLSQDQLNQLFADQSALYYRNDQNLFIISSDPMLITMANVYGFDTCFINSGLNDTITYHTTYEVSQLEKIKKIRLKGSK